MGTSEDVSLELARRLTRVDKKLCARPFMDGCGRIARVGALLGVKFCWRCSFKFSVLWLCAKKGGDGGDPMAGAVDRLQVV